MIMGLLVNIFTENPAKHKIRGYCLTNVSGQFNPCEEYPEAVLVSRTNFCGSGQNAVHIVPVKDGLQINGSFGGKFAYTSDSRFREAVTKLTNYPWMGAVAVHDRTD